MSLVIHVLENQQNDPINQGNNQLNSPSAEPDASSVGENRLPTIAQLQPPLEQSIKTRLTATWATTHDVIDQMPILLQGHGSSCCGKISV